MRALSSLSAAVVLLLHSAASPAPSIVIEHVNVITMLDSLVRQNYSVVVRGSNIEWVGPSAKARIPKGAKRIDGRGKFLIPGFADMHVHMDAADTLLYIANGVTQVREMNGTPALLALRDAVRQGKTLGPMMSVSSPLLAGEKQRWRHELVETSQAGSAIVRAEKAAGYDAIKVYDGLKPDTYEAIVAEARAVGIPVVGHIPHAVGLDGVLAAHQRTLEHGDQIISAISNAPHEGSDSALIAETARKIRAAGSWVTPTIAVEYALNTTGTTGYSSQLERPEMQYQDSATLAWWASLAKPRQGSALSTDEFRSAKSKEYFGYKQLLVRELEREGAPMLAGTDTPNPLMVPGFSLVDELMVLSRAGLSNYRVLRMATSDAGTFLNQKFGGITPGNRADMILLDRNPLTDLTALRRPDAVMVRGRWLDRETLDGFLAKSLKH